MGFLGFVGWDGGFLETSFVVVHGFQRGFDLGLEDSFRFVSGKPVLKIVVGMEVVDATTETSGVA